MKNFRKLNKCMKCRYFYADLIDLHNQKFLCKNCWMNQFDGRFTKGGW